VPVTCISRVGSASAIRHSFSSAGGVASPE
jgi:hypothetical protein